MPAAPEPAAAPARHCAILAGGAGDRIGGGKPQRLLAGRPLAAYPIAAAEAAGLRPLLVAKPGTDLIALEQAGTEVLREPERPRHPLLGIVTALARLREPIVVCACDLPLVPAGLLAHLAELPAGAAAAVVAAAPGAIEPLLGRYEPSALPALESGVAAERSARGTVAALHPLIVEGPALRAFGPLPEMLSNVNTPEDLARLERLLPEA